MPTLVLDTNVWLDWLVFDDPSSAALAAAAHAKRICIVSTGPMHDELADVLGRPQFKLTAQGRLACLDLFSRQSRRVPAPPALAGRLGLVCRDPDDQKFLDLACLMAPCSLLSRDKALLSLARRGRRHGLAILSPLHWRPEPPLPTGGTPAATRPQPGGYAP